jgi:hypothetical protein
MRLVQWSHVLHALAASAAAVDTVAAAVAVAVKAAVDTAAAMAVVDTAAVAAVHATKHDIQSSVD